MVALGCGDDGEEGKAGGPDGGKQSGDGDHQGGDGDQHQQGGDGDGDQQGGDGDGVVENPLTNPQEGPPAGNPDGKCAVPSGAGLEDSSKPTTVVGSGTAASCTGDAFINAVAKGGVITFNCGSEPVTITLDRPAKIFNDKGPKIIIDGGGLVTLSGAGKTRILYMNTCDEKQKWTTGHCDNQDHPQLTVQNLTFVDANSTAEKDSTGGGAIFASGGRLKIVNSRFFSNQCVANGADVGGGAVRAFQQYNALPIYVVNSTFGGGPELGNSCSNGGAINSIGVSWTVINSDLSYNKALGKDGGGSGGAIANDGNEMTLSLCGVTIQHNEVAAFGSALIFTSNNHTGNIVIKDSTITENVGGSWYPKYPQLSHHEDTPVDVTNSTIK